MKKTLILTISFFILLTVFVQAEEAEIVTLFSPEDSCGLAIQKYISEAEDYVFLAMYYFTLRRLAQELADAHKRGIEVRVFLDSKQRVEKYAKGRFLEKRGIEVKYRGDETSGYMHSKFCVIDDRVVITGSFNWTVSADLKNDENLIIIESTDVAKSYKNYFNRLWEGKIPDTYRYKDKVGLEKMEIDK